MNSIVDKKNLLDLSYDETIQFFESIGEKSFRANQLLKWIHQNGVTDFHKMSNFSKLLRNYLSDNCIIQYPKILLEENSEDGTKKWLLSVGNNQSIEMVLIPDKGRNTLCVSSRWMRCKLQFLRYWETRIFTKFIFKRNNRSSTDCRKFFWIS